MSYDHTEFEHCGFKCIVAYDHDPQSPEDWGNTDYFLGEVEGARYKFGREDESKAAAYCYIPFGEGPWSMEWEGDHYDADYETEEALRESWEDEHIPGFHVFAVRVVDYGSNGAMLNFVDHDRAHGYIFIKVPWSSELEELAHPEFDAQKIADSLLDEWNQYLTGDVHWARIEDSDGDTIESCGGFYGHKDAEEWCRDEAEGHGKMTRPVTVVVTKASQPLNLPATVKAQIYPIAVPLSVGTEKIGDWAVLEGPFKNDKDVVQVDVFRPCTCGPLVEAHRQLLAGQEVPNGQ